MLKINNSKLVATPVPPPIPGKKQIRYSKQRRDRRQKEKNPPELVAALESSLLPTTVTVPAPTSAAAAAAVIPVPAPTTAAAVAVVPVPVPTAATEPPLDKTIFLRKKRVLTSGEVISIARSNSSFNIFYTGIPFRDHREYRQFLINYNSNKTDCMQCISLYNLHKGHMFKTSGHCIHIDNNSIIFLERTYLLKKRVIPDTRLRRSIDKHLIQCVMMSYTLDHFSPLQISNDTANTTARASMINSQLDKLSINYNNEVVNVIKAKYATPINANIDRPVLIDISHSLSNNKNKHPHAFMHIGYTYDMDISNNCYCIIKNIDLPDDNISNKINAIKSEVLTVTTIYSLKLLIYY